MLYYMTIAIMTMLVMTQVYINIKKLKRIIEIFRKREKAYRDFIDMLEEHYSNESVDAEIIFLKKRLELSDYWVKK